MIFNRRGSHAAVRSSHAAVLESHAAVSAPRRSQNPNESLAAVKSLPRCRRYFAYPPLQSEHSNPSPSASIAAVNFVDIFPSRFKE